MGGSNLLDGRPAPISPVGWFARALLGVRCLACGKTNALHIGMMVQRYRLPPSTRIHAIGPRLRCATCGGPGKITGVSGWRR